MSDIELTLQQPRHFVGIRRSLSVQDLGAFFAEVFPRVMGWLTERDIAPASMPMAMWCAMDMESGVADCHAGCFVHEPVEADGEITPGQTPGGDVLTITNLGPYTTVGQSWMRVYQRAGELGRPPGPGWEIYANDPTEVPEAEIRTEIFLPLS